MSVLKYIFFAFCLSLTPFLAAQSTYLHLDKEFYVAGENIWYKLYLPTEFEGQNASVKVVVSNRNQQVVDQYFLKNEERNYVAGYYKIGFNLQPDLYRISYFYNTTRLASGVIPIYNDLQVPKLEQLDEPTTDNLPQLNELNIAIAATTNYSTRNDVNFTIDVKDQNGQAVESTLSVAVFDHRMVENAQIVAGETVTLTDGNNSTVQSGGIPIEGTVLKEGKPIRANVLGIYSISESKFFYAKADEQGQFRVELPDFSGTKAIQFLSYQLEHDRIDSRLDGLELLPIEGKLLYTEAVLDYLTLSQQRKRIYQAYTTLENQLAPEKVLNEVQIYEPDFTYVIDEYKSFDFMYSFFNELITPLKFPPQKDGTFSAQLDNPTGNFSKNTLLSGNPLFIIDGKLTRNADFVANLDMDYIDEVSLYYKTERLKKIYSAMGRSGVISIKTNLRNISIPDEDAANVYKINGVLPKANFPVFDPTTTAANLPIFRPQLYWNPDVSTDTSGKTTINFTQTDDVGRFKIVVVAKSKDGKMGYATQVYDVKL